MVQGGAGGFKPRVAHCGDSCLLQAHPAGQSIHVAFKLACEDATLETDCCAAEEEEETARELAEETTPSHRHVTPLQVPEVQGFLSSQPPCLLRQTDIVPEWGGLPLYGS